MIERNGDDYQLRYGDLCIPFRIESGARKRLSITVFPDLRLRVLAPESALAAAVLARVEARARWIAKQWREFAGAAPATPPRLYVGGETHWYLGRQYRLKLREPEDGEREGVKLRGRFFWIMTRDKADAARARRLLEDWYQTRARAFFAERLRNCWLETRALELESLPPFEVRRMSKRWGSCTARGKILLNLELVQAPPSCVDYVIIHELCHLKHPHHGPQFYELLGRCLPDWEKRKARLEEFGR